MSSSTPSKGYVSFRVNPQSVSFVLVKYGDKNQTLRSYRYDKIEGSAVEISLFLADYPGAEDRWKKFFEVKLPRVRKRQEETRRKLSYEDISKALDEIVWSIERHKAEDKAGRKGGKDLAIKIWGAWSSIRSVISSTTYWGVKEEDALVSLGLKSKNTSGSLKST